MNPVISHAVRFAVLVLVQVLVLNGINLGGSLNPWLYVLFILLLPVRTPKALLLFLAFFTGLSIDAFSDTGGMHAAASVFMAFCRPGIIGMLRHDEEKEGSPLSVKTYGLKWFAYYTTLLVFLHHAVLFFTEAFGFSEFWPTLLRVLFSTLLTSALIITCSIIFSGNRTR